MTGRSPKDARTAVIIAAGEEAGRRGDQRIGTDHILLALLHGPESLAVSVLGIDLQTASAAADDLDRVALASVGVHLDSLPLPMSIQTHRRPPLTSAARAVLQHSANEALRDKARRVEVRHLVLGILSREHPDPAAELLAALGVDPGEVRRRLAGS